jgi:uncharacterized protein
VDDVTGNARLPAGEFSAWLRTMRAALAGDGETATPCDDCSACCSTSHFVRVGPDERETLANIPDPLHFAAPGAPAGHVVLPYDEHGRCPLLSRRGRCAIYDHRPRTCRVYDCRVFAAAGIAADREPITRRAARWEFSFADDRGRRQLAAVRATVRFVREHAALFPGGDVPEDPAGLAVLAVTTADVFLDGPGAAGRDAAAADVAEAIVAAASKGCGAGGACGR